MAKRKTSDRIVVFPGTFDPPTNGHLDLITRGCQLFDQLIIAVGQNPEKQALFDTGERLEMLRELTAPMKNVKVTSYTGLTMDFVRASGANAILRGIRDGTDLYYEMQQANANLIVGDVETVFLLSRDQNILTSSTLIKQIVQMGGPDPKRLRRLVPATVVTRLRKRAANGR